MATPKKSTNELIEDLAVMTKQGFDRLDQKIDDVKAELSEKLDKIEFNTNSQERRISILEDKVRIISTKIGLSK